MWGRAVRVIPRVTPAQWRDLDVVSRWLIATRSAVLVMTVVAAAIAGLLAVRDGVFDGLRWLALVVGLTFAHAANNLVNDWTDSATGVDKDNYFRTRYGPQPIEHGLMTPGQVAGYAAVTGAIALAAGVWLVATHGGTTWPLLAIGAFFVLFYTWPLKSIGLGEIAVLIVWGPLMVGGGYQVIGGEVSAQVLWASVPFSLAATTVLFGKHIDKIDADAAKGIRTLPVLLGERRARAATIVLIASQYGVVAGLVATGAFTPALAVVALAAPTAGRAVRVFRAPRPDTPPPDYPEGVWPLWYAAFAFGHTRVFGGLYLVGLVADVAWHRLAPA
jgi:1,4-dihydroxy-2-naphthoate octaprenyltransferase